MIGWLTILIAFEIHYITYDIRHVSNNVLLHRFLRNMAASIKFLSALRSSEYFVLVRSINSLRKSTASKTLRSLSYKKCFSVISFPRRLVVAGSLGLAGVTLAALAKSWVPAWQPVAAESRTKLEVNPSRCVRLETDNSGLKLSLFQFQTCPFCCKVRAMLDYYGFSYDIVEVNSVTKKQIKWSNYKKVPILVIDGIGESGYLQINDSSVIISLLESWRQDPQQSLQKLLDCYVILESEEKRKKVYDYPNKYFIMLMEHEDLSSTPLQRQDERKWRKWADDHLVHMLSPNVYRSPAEALQAFRYFSEVGEWEKNFSTLERWIVIWTGAAVMYILGKVLKRKYKLKDDVRESLYDACNEWMQAVGTQRTFHGGDQPNLADLAVYGVLNSIEGCEAFQDVLACTSIGTWYRAMQRMVQSHAGGHPLSKHRSQLAV